MQDRTCPVCGSVFTPATKNQTYCPPSAQERARAKTQPRSRCASRAMNHAQRTREGRRTITLTAALPAPFDCEECGTRCVPGENVDAKATRFCGADCKKEWHGVQHGKRPRGERAREIEGHRLEQWSTRLLAEPTPRDITVYRRSLRADPCSYCGGPGEALDHIEPRSSDGEDGWANRTSACHRCNSLKGTLPLLTALPWIPVAAEYHTMRRALYPAAA